MLHGGPANAQAGVAEDQQSQGVEVKGVKDPAFMPYRQAYDLAAGASEVTGGHATLVIRVTSSQTHQPIPELRLRIVGEKSDAPVPIAPDGVIDLPLNKAFYVDGADIVANKPKKSLAVDIHVVPQFASKALRFEDLLAATSAGQAALAKVVPWYLRIVMPSVHGVGLCYPATGQTVAVAGEPRLATEVATDPKGVTVYCANFSAKEAEARRETMLEAPEGWQALYW